MRGTSGEKKGEENAAKGKEREVEEEAFHGVLVV